MFSNCFENDNVCSLFVIRTDQTESVAVLVPLLPVNTVYCCHRCWLQEQLSTNLDRLFCIAEITPPRFIYKPCRTTLIAALSHLYRRRSVMSEYHRYKNETFNFPETCRRRSCSGRTFIQSRRRRTEKKRMHRCRSVIDLEPRLSVEHAVASECITLIMKLK